VYCRNLRQEILVATSDFFGKSQIPNKFQNLKAQFPTLWRVLGFGFWRFEASLGFGNWILELPPLAVVEHFVSGSVEDCEEWTIKL